MSAPLDVVLCINTGSSSLKFSAFSARGADLSPIAAGAAEGIGSSDGVVWLQHGEKRHELRHEKLDRATALGSAFTLLDRAGVPPATIVGHRVVHGGELYREPIRVDDKLIADLKSLVPLAPLHLPPALEVIETIRRQRPEIAQIACFDTAFHASLPEIAWQTPIPARFRESGIRRYGFHGLSYEYILSVLGKAAPRRIIIAHLGSGASLVAVKDGLSIDTTMGLTPAGGIPMATRCGDLDPGVLIYLLRHQNLSVDELEHVLVQQSGLAALGDSSDVKTLIERAPHDAAAKLALSLFAYSVRKVIGAYFAALGGLDLLVFTGGIGEHAASVRAEACQDLRALGIELDPERNGRNADIISSDSSPCLVRVIPTDEDQMIARHALSTILATGPSRQH
jgi:acetate kinase